MGDNTAVVPSSSNQKPKEGGPPSIQCPMLNATNYTVWAMRMKVLLKVSKVWEVVDTESLDGDKNDMATALLFQSIPEALILQVGALDTAKKVWDAIKARHMGAERVREARLQTLMAEFDRLKMKTTETIDDFGGKLSEISSKAAALGEIIEESKLVKKFLKSLPRQKYIHIVASLEQVLDLNSTTFEDIIGRLKAYEERIGEEDEEEEYGDQKKLMYANTNSQAGYHENYGYNRGRGRGGRYNWRGRGRGRYGNSQNESWNQGQDKERDDSMITCYRCDKLGHYASDCPDRLLKLQEAQERKSEETQEADELMVHEVVYLNEKKVKPSNFEADLDTKNVWYLDNGASNHMSGNRSFFASLDETVAGKVRFGDNSRLDIKGKGSIRFGFQDGNKKVSKVLKNVYYMPDLKSNIISLGQATEEGCEVRMKEDLLMLYDRTGQLLVRTNRSRNRLYKVILEVENIPYLQQRSENYASGLLGKVSKTEAAGRKKLDERSRTLVHLGTESGSNVYYLSKFTTTKRMIISRGTSRDVVFDERKSWSWNKVEKETLYEVGRLIAGLRGVCNKGIKRIKTEENIRVMNENETVKVVEEKKEGAGHESYEDNSGEEPQPQLRRSTRAVVKPAWLKDYILLAETECERLLVAINEESWNFQEARRIKVWVEACKKELCSIEKNKTWNQVDRLGSVKPIRLKWVFKINRNADGSINKHKARLVMKSEEKVYKIEEMRSLIVIQDAGKEDFKLKGENVGVSLKKA